MHHHRPKYSLRNHANRNLPLAGFTLIEILIVIGIIAAISVVSIIGLQGSKSTTDLKSSTSEMVNLLRQAESQSVSGYQGATWGVHFENATYTTPFFALFYGSYASATIVNRYILPTDVQFSSSSMPLGSSLTITFAPTSGVASTSTSITVNSVSGAGSGGSNPASVGRQSSGKVFFDNFNRTTL